MATAVKICGITRPHDALAAARHGAHAVGFVFHPGSPRYLEPERASAIASALPAFVTAVGLFVDADEARVRSVLERVPLQLLQFHGAEPPEYCGRFSIPYIKALRMKPGTDLLQYAARYQGARGLLLDAFVEGSYGGTGATFDWSAIPSGLALPLILAGGLHPGNVEQAIRQVRPWAVDVSSGVESSPGIKDEQKIAAFIRGARHADE